MLSCKEVGELLSKGLDQQLSFRERMSLKIHLMICKGCSRYQEQLRFVARSAQRLMYSNKRDQGLPPLSDEVGIRINNSIDQQLQQKKLNHPDNDKRD